MPDIKLYLPDDLHISELEPEEIATHLLQFFNEIGPEPSNQDYHSYSNRHNFIAGLKRRFAGSEVRLIIEAYVWLEHERFLIPSPDHPDQCLVLSRRGARARDSGALERLRRAEILPHGLLHPKIADRVWPLFIRSDYENSVSVAFKEVEIAVREAADLPPTATGTALMRSAFHPDTGKLSDPNDPRAERQARADLFAGAMGSFRNPAAHRRFDVEEPAHAAEIVMLGSLLLRIVDACPAASETSEDS